MIKCCSCQKVFEYEKYYGICPKCGTFNPKGKKNILKEEDREIIHQFDTQNAGTRTKAEKVLIFLLSSGIVIACGGIVFQIFSMTAGKNRAYTAETDWQEKETFEYTKEKSAEPFTILDGQITITVEGAKEVESEASGIPGYPENEKLIAVPVEFLKCEEYDFLENILLQEPYVRYLSTDGQNIYKKSIYPADFEEYDVDYGPMVSYYDFIYKDTAEGSLMFFIDPEATELEFYLPEQNEKEEIQAIYKINLPILEKEDK